MPQDTTTYTKALAGAIATAPSACEALALWNAANPHLSPKPHSVLGAALSHENIHAVRAVAQWLGGVKLDEAQQGSALDAWRRSPSTTRTLSVRQETDMGRELVELGLIDANAHVPGNETRPGGGPVSVLLQGFREHAARGVLRALAQPDPDDLARALLLCARKIDRSRVEWVELLGELLDREADPGRVAPSPKKFDAEAAANQVANQARVWSKLPLDLTRRMLGGQLTEWTRTTQQGHCYLSRWLREGDVDVGMELAAGQSLDAQGLFRCLYVLVQEVKPYSCNHEASIDKLFDGRVKLAALSLQEICEISGDLYRSYLRSARGNAGERMVVDNLVHLTGKLCSLAPAGQRKQAREGGRFLVGLIREEGRRLQKSAIGNGVGSTEDAITRVTRQIDVFLEANQLDHATPRAPAARSSPRL